MPPFINRVKYGNHVGALANTVVGANLCRISGTRIVFHSRSAQARTCAPVGLAEEGREQALVVML